MSDEKTFDPQRLDTVTMNIAVYELTRDQATGETKPSFKQTNNSYQVRSYYATVARDVTYNELKERVLEALAVDAKDLRELQIYPLMVNQYIKDPDYVSEDDKRNYQYAYGYLVEERKPDPNKPIVAPTDLEGRAKAVEEALKPYYVHVPFIMAAPYDRRFMSYISFDYTPEGAVIEFDSSKHERDPHLDQDETIIQSDITRVQISAEDRELFNKFATVMRQIAAETEAEAKKNGVTDKIVVNYDFERIAKEVGLENGEIARNELDRISALMVELNPEYFQHMMEATQSKQ